MKKVIYLVYDHFKLFIKRDHLRKFAERIQTELIIYFKNAEGSNV